MTTVIQTRAGNVGYRHQLDRARRFLDRVLAGHEGLKDLNDVEFQDMMWAFFQNCWHVKDWLRNDPLATDQQKDAAIDMAHQSPVLKVCQDLCNGTKHLKLKQWRSGTTGARHDHVAFTMHAMGVGATEDIPNEIDSIIEDGKGNLISGKQLAKECVAEWERILASQGLATTPLS